MLRYKIYGGAATRACGTGAGVIAKSAKSFPFVFVRSVA
jgi:hypothetical protein